MISSMVYLFSPLFVSAALCTFRRRHHDRRHPQRRAEWRWLLWEWHRVGRRRERSQGRATATAVRSSAAPVLRLGNRHRGYLGLQPTTKAPENFCERTQTVNLESAQAKVLASYSAVVDGSEGRVSLLDTCAGCGSRQRSSRLRRPGSRSRLAAVRPYVPRQQRVAPLPASTTPASKPLRTPLRPP